MFHVIFLLFATIISVTFSNGGNVNHPIVHVEQGRVRGGIGKTIRLGKPYYYFRGIPYAQPPIGNLRFMPPVPKQNWDIILDTIDDQSECVQGLNPVTGSENCLFLNVYTPVLPIDSTATLPVMVWFHNGAFIMGNSSYRLYGPDYFLEEEVIVVSLNYRLGIFGFLSTEDLVVPGNNGLKDQNLAMQWVQKNIDRFGGDPTRVTIFGQSSGSASVSYHLQSPLSKGLFSAALMESGTSLCLWAFPRNIKLSAEIVAINLNVNGTTSESLVEGLRQVDYITLQTVSGFEDIWKLRYMNSLDGLIFGPVKEVDHDGAFFTKRSHEALLRGEFNRVPTIIGFTSQEGKLFINPTKNDFFPLTKNGFIMDRLTPFDMNADLYNKYLVGYKLRNHYFPNFSFTDENVAQFLSDDQFNRPIRETVRLMSLYSPVYYYGFTYQGVRNTVSSVPGVQHNEELAFFWITALYSLTDNPHNAIVRERLLKLWTNFAKFRNPTPPGSQNELINVTWPIASPGRNSNTLRYLEIGYELSIKANPKETNWKYWKYLYGTYGNPPYDTY